MRASTSDAARAAARARPLRVLALLACLLYLVALRSAELQNSRALDLPVYSPDHPFPQSAGAWIRRATPQELHSVLRSSDEGSSESAALSLPSPPLPPPMGALKDLHPNSTLARLRARGVPFIDNWDRWPAPPCLLPDWEAVASQSMSVNSNRWKINAIWNPHGFGSNFVSHANFIIFAMFHNASMILVKRKELSRGEFLTADEAKLENERSQPQMLFEELFAYDRLGDTTILGYHKLCRYHANGTSPCEPPIWTFPGNTENAEYWLNRFRKSDVMLFRTIKTLLYRDLLTLTPKMRKEVDRRFLEAVPNPDRRPWVAVHVRRGDKVRKHEADLTEAKDYIRACVKAGMAGVRDVYVMSDDPLAAREIEGNWTTYGGQPGARFHRRFDPLRPDKTTVTAHQRNSFLHLLTDVRIMLESDVFIGSHTSNIGITVCTSRAWMLCMDAENAEGEYFWNGSTDKVRGRRRRLFSHLSGM